MSLSGPGVQDSGNSIAFHLAEMIKVRDLLQILRDQSIGVFMGASFPGVVGIGKVELNSTPWFNPHVAVELTSMV